MKHKILRDGLNNSAAVRDLVRSELLLQLKLKPQLKTKILVACKKDWNKNGIFV